MGVTITSRLAPDAPALHMSNGLASVLLEALLLAGSPPPEGKWEQALLYWLAQHDQMRIGHGAHFDIADFGWTHFNLESQRRFVLNLINDAMARRNWDHLDYQPREETVFGALSRFRDQVSSLTQAPTEAGAWVAGEAPAFGICDKHQVFLHDMGCIICNNAPIGS